MMIDFFLFYLFLCCGGEMDDDCFLFPTSFYFFRSEDRSGREREMMIDFFLFYLFLCCGGEMDDDCFLFPTSFYFFRSEDRSGRERWWLISFYSIYFFAAEERWIISFFCFFLCCERDGIMTNAKRSKLPGIVALVASLPSVLVFGQSISAQVPRWMDLNLARYHSASRAFRPRASRWLARPAESC